MGVYINQLGYIQKGKKIAVFEGYEGKFIVKEEGGAVVFSGYTTKLAFDKNSRSSVSYGDFSELEAKGIYHVLGEHCSSHSFEINENPYESLHQGLLKAFYFYRCGMELTEEYAGRWGHQICHNSPAIVYADQSKTIDCNGGWHDAGDYGKYTVPGAKAVADLLLAFELYPTAFAKTVPIPETDGVTPDVLHECRYELEWLLKMQDRESGGVYHKVTTLEFPGLDVMPENDTASLYVSPISATATGCFSAVMAQASRIYQPYDCEFAAKCNEAAFSAWAWLDEHPIVAGFRNPPEIKTGQYEDDFDLDERYWAVAELFRLTGKQTFHEKFRSFARESLSTNALGWADVGGYGTIAYLLNGREKADELIFEELLGNLVEAARLLVKKSKKDGFAVSLAAEDYIWGSNMLVMNNSMHLLFAYYFTGVKDFESCALDHLHYLLGRNCLDISYVTGYGTNSVMNPHHRPSCGDQVKEPVPGLVSGGPNFALQDEYVKEHLVGRAPAQSFVDHEDSYSTNEVTIYWNSPALFVVSHFIK